MSSRANYTTPSMLPEDSFKHSPLEHVRTLFLSFIQGLFEAQPAGGYHWDPDPETSEIYISSENPVHIETIGMRPAVSVTRGPVSFYGLGLDDMLELDYKTGAKTKSVLVPGTMSINVISRVATECENLAWSIAENLWMNRELLMRAGFFEVGRQPQIGSTSPAGSLVAGDGGDGFTVVSVSCPFQFYRTSRRTPLGAKIIREIGFSLRGRMVPHEGTGGPVSSGSVDLPFGIEACPTPPFSTASDAYGNTPSPGNAAPQLPVLHHPLNPSQRVVIVPVRPNQQGVRPASIGGRPIPIITTCVPESSQNDVVVGKSKV